MKTILVTGGTGYVGSWTVKLLLEQGYTVRLAVRNKSNTIKYSYLQDIALSTNGTIEIWEADLLKEGSYNDAAQGADVIMHIASPFTLRIKDPYKELVQPALDGTRNVLEAANQSSTVQRVILTSSVAAIHGDNADMHTNNLQEFTEEHYNETSTLQHQPYSYSKVLAEKGAWEIYNKQSKWDMVVINPSFVLGPPLSKDSNSESLQLISDILKGKYRFGVPNIHFGFVDVRDVAQAHCNALNNNIAPGRHIVSGSIASIWDICSIIKNRFPNKYKLPNNTIPKFIIIALGWLFGLKAKFLRQNIGYSLMYNTSKSINDLNITYTELEKTLVDMVNTMVSKGRF